jgi:hypothetical protein
MDALARIATSKEGGRGSDPIETTSKILSVVRDINDITGQGGGAEAVPRDFPSLLVDKVTGLAPEVMNYLERRQGAQIDREEINKMFKEYGLRMYQELNTTIKKEVQGGFQQMQQRRQAAAARTATAPSAPPGAPGARPQAGVPAPAPAVPPPPRPVQAPTVPPVKPIQFEGPSPTAAAKAPPAPAAAPAPAPAEGGEESLLLTDEQKNAITSTNVNYVLKGLLREMQLGIEGMTWPEKAWEMLPMDVRDRIVTASTDQDVYDAVQPWADPKILDAIWSFISEANEKHEFYREWLTEGVNWIKDMATGNLPAEGDQSG